MASRKGQETVIRYGSVCSGIEAATVAWHHMGWSPAWFSEIEPFPSAVLKHHYPTVPNLGDMTKYEAWPDEPIDLLVGGTPCQSFSVAGLRKGLDDPRGNLMLTFGAIAQRYRPRWLVWENVPGVLSSNNGRDFGTFLGMLGELGYGFAYRILDAQYFGVAQRRRRVFVVGYLGSWERAAAVLFERESLRWDTPPSRKARQEIAPTIAGCSNRGGANGPGRDVDSCESLQVITLAHGQGGAEIGFNRGPTLTCIHEAPIAAYMQPVGVPDVMATLLSSTAGISRPGNAVTEHETYIPMAAATTMQVRRLTPVECERLQGFPDGYTNISWRKKDEAPDGPRYKALGNSMAVPVMRWIGERIQQVEEL